MPGIDCDLIFSANYTQPIASLYLQDRDRDLLDGESNDPREPIQAPRNPGRVTRASLNPVKATSDAKPRMYYSRLAGERAGRREAYRGFARPVDRSVVGSEASTNKTGGRERSNADAIRSEPNHQAEEYPSRQCLQERIESKRRSCSLDFGTPRLKWRYKMRCLLHH